MPLFSIIVPVYNAESYLSVCIEAILLQTFSNYELIIIDDGSTDHSGEICDRYRNRDERIHVIHQNNGGQTSARKTGAAHACGDYIVCIDADDWVPENYLAALAKQIEAYFPDMICCDLHRFSAAESPAKWKEDEKRKKRIAYGYPKVRSGKAKQRNQEINGRKADKKEKAFARSYSGFYNRKRMEEEIYPLLIQSEQATYFLPWLCSKAIKRNIFCAEQNRIPENFRIGEDGLCTICCLLQSHSISFAADTYYAYRQTTTSITHQKKAFVWEGPKEICLHIQNRLKEMVWESQTPSGAKEFSKEILSGFQKQLYRKTVHELFSVIISQFYREESYSAICRDIRDHLKDPFYAEAIRKAEFSESRQAAAMLFVLRHRLCFPILIWSKIKNKRMP